MHIRFAQIGNFGPSASTENDLRRAIPAAGHDVIAFQENDPDTFRLVAERLDEFDVVLWTKTDWDPPVPHADMRQLLAAARARGVPVVGYHLDIWHGLKRVDQVAEHPFFRCDVLITADGGHDDAWAAAGVNHRWFAPGVSEFECIGGAYLDRFAADVAFVGSWQGGYHAEHPHREQLVRHLHDHWGNVTRFWPEVGEERVSGETLRDLYSSTKVNIGDSCFAGSPHPVARYWSDRVPETLGRGGFLLHPHVEGIEDHYVDGVHLRLWEAGNWRELDQLIAHYIDHDQERRDIARQGRAHVLDTATYTVRVRQVVSLMFSEGMLTICGRGLGGESMCLNTTPCAEHPKVDA